MSEDLAYCSGCGKPRLIVVRTIDGRYPIVQCGRVRRPGLLSLAAARSVIRERRARLKLRKAELRRTYGEEKRRRDDPRLKAVR